MTPRWARRLATPALRTLRSLDRAAGRARRTRTILIEARTPLNLAVLRPIIDRLLEDDRLHLTFTGADLAVLSPAFDELGATDRVIPRSRAMWSRIDLYMNADPWDALTLRRAARQMNFFHGVAGKYDLDCPTNLPLDFNRYDRVAFPNERRLRGYVAAGIVLRERAALVGYPKVDALVSGSAAPAAAAGVLRLDTTRQTVIYAPTFSPASSLHTAGEAIIDTLLAGGWNVIVKLHDRSFDRDPKYSGGVDWHTRLERFHQHDRFLLASSGDSTPYVLASDLMITDHSSIGFEFCLLDRPLVIFDVPKLVAAARINPEKVALLRSAATVVSTTDALTNTVRTELQIPARLSGERRSVADAVFYRPGGATGRALALIYELLALPAREPALQLARAWSDVR